MEKWSGSGGFLYLRGAKFGAVRGDFIEFEFRIEDLLVSDLGFGEPDVPFVTFLLALFGGFAAGFGRFRPLLRFEANFRAPLFGSKL